MNYLITQTGRKIDCRDGQQHETVCKTILRITLSEFLSRKHKGIRVKLYGEQGSVEGYDYPNAQQVGKIRSILRHYDVYQLVTSFRGNYNVQKSFSRPIRGIKI